MARSRDILGRGFGFPLLPAGDGGFAWTEGSENIQHSLKVLLLTRLGERLMRPGFGTAAPRLLFAARSEQNLRLLETSIRDAVVEHEARVDLLEVRAEAHPVEDTRVEVGIRYRERRTNAVGNLVFPFYLDEVSGS